MLQEMTSQWISLLAPAAQDRLTLLLNHVLSRESVAMERLKPHQGATVLVELKGWPALLPMPPALALQITPAGLLERLAAVPEQPSLRVQLDASNPAAMALGALTGVQPKVEIQGDAGLATDMNWLMQNLRWDIEDDLAKLLGPAPAHELARWGKGIAAAGAKLAQSVAAINPMGPSGGGRGAR
ncbi:MAG: SCP2 sterol-binding domain-containing protein [Burkholderiaceae bacterium]|nr:SCP2 sterol-binding domain-containing protein [Burkholderiaceae bacterium]